MARGIKDPRKQSIAGGTGFEAVSLDLGIEELMAVLKGRNFTFSQEEAEAIKRHFATPSVIEERGKVGLGAPTWRELELIDRTWREQRERSIFYTVIDYEGDGGERSIAGLFEAFIAGSTQAVRSSRVKRDFCLSALQENSAVLRFNRKYDLVFKVETRDVLTAADQGGDAAAAAVAEEDRGPSWTGEGVKPLFSAEAFCLAPPDYDGPASPSLLSRLIMKQVREGLKQGGGIGVVSPASGPFVFDAGYLLKPFVFSETCTIVRRQPPGTPPGMGVSSTVAGEVTDTGKICIMDQGRTMAYLDIALLREGPPRLRLSAKWERRLNDETPLREPEPYVEALRTVLGRWNVCSRECSDGTMVSLGCEGGGAVVVSHGVCPKFSGFDTYHMVACAIDEAIRNNIAGGGSLSRMALLVNFCWPDPVLSDENPEGPYRLAQLVRANMALSDYTTLFRTPCIAAGGRIRSDSLYQDSKISVPPTVLVAALSTVPDAGRAITMDFKAAGHLIAVVGETYPELGGSEYFSSRGKSGNIAPKVRGNMAGRVFRRMERAIAMGLVRSCHAPSHGGLAVALAEGAFAGNYGAEVDLLRVPSTAIFRDDFLLFSESQSRFIVSLRKQDLKKLSALFKGIPWAVIGTVRGDGRFLAKGRLGQNLMDTDIAVLKEARQAPFQHLFDGP